MRISQGCIPTLHKEAKLYKNIVDLHAGGDRKGAEKEENVLLQRPSSVLLTPKQKQEKPISHHACANKQAAIMVFNNVLFCFALILKFARAGNIINYSHSLK